MLATRLDRLAQMEQSTADADARLQALAAGRSSPPGDIRLRHGFVRLFNPDSNADTSSRKATSREQRPPSTRLMSPRGRALSFLLIALFEAQMRLAPGQAACAERAAVEGRERLCGLDGLHRYRRPGRHRGPDLHLRADQESTSDPVELDQTVRRESGQRPASRRPPPSLRGLRANA